MELNLVLMVEDAEELWNTASSKYKSGNKRAFIAISKEVTGSKAHGKDIYALKNLKVIN
jgi:hypothetical protein